MTPDRIRFIAHVMGRINDHYQAGRITAAQRLRYFALVVAEYAQG